MKDEDLPLTTVVEEAYNKVWEELMDYEIMGGLKDSGVEEYLKSPDEEQMIPTIIGAKETFLGAITKLLNKKDVPKVLKRKIVKLLESNKVDIPPEIKNLLKEADV